MKKFIFVLALVLVVAMALGTGIVALAASGTSTTDNGLDKDQDVNLDPKPIVEETKCDHATLVDEAIFPDGTCSGGTLVQRCVKCKTIIKVYDASELTAAQKAMIAAKGHQLDYTNVKNVVAGSCTTPGSRDVYCVICKKYITEKTGGSHTYVKIVEKPATCVSAGVNKVLCTVCGDWHLEDVDQLKAHTFDMKAATTFVAKRATCAADGTYNAVCTVCGGTFEYGREVIASAYGTDAALTAANPRGTDVLRIKATGHKWDAGTIVATANCKNQTNGKIVYKCLYNTQTAEHEPCYQTKEVIQNWDETVFDPRVQQVIEKSHVLKEHVQVAATATTYGIHWYECTVCGKKWNETSYLASSSVSYNGQYNGGTAAGNKGTTTTTSKTTSKATSSSTNKKGVSIPKTNDTTSNLPYVLIAVAFVGLVALVASKKKVNG